MRLLSVSVQTASLRAIVSSGFDVVSCAGPVPFHLSSADIAQVLSIWNAIARDTCQYRGTRDLAMEAGRILFDALLGSPAVYPLYLEALETVRAARREECAAAVLHLWIAAPDSLAVLPWELLFDARAQFFLGGSDHVSISRCPEPDGDLVPPRRWAPPLKLLLVMASPSPGWDLPATVELDLPCDTLALERRLRLLSDAYGPKAFRYRLLAGAEATRESLEHHLHRERCDIFYFVGHSYAAHGETYFLLEDGSDLRQAEKVSSSELGEWLQTAHVRVVILSSCESLAGAAALARLRHLDAVAGMQIGMPILSAGWFDSSVLGALAAWLPVETSISQGRQRVRELLSRWTNRRSELQGLDRPDWAIPALFTRCPAELENFCTLEADEHTLGVSLEELRGTGLLPDWFSMFIREPRVQYLPKFKIACSPVANHEFRRFLESTPHPSLPPGFLPVNGTICLDGLDPGDPVVNISREEALKYCNWAELRLPSADEWEATARGIPRRLEKLGEGFEWTSTANYVVGSCRDSNPALRLLGLRCPRDPVRRYPDVGFRCAQ